MPTTITYGITFSMKFMISGFLRFGFGFEFGFYFVRMLPITVPAVQAKNRNKAISNTDVVSTDA